ncbi:MAG TPA: DUF5668 domain-containing protein, partial [Vicinamibacteria bacterium]
YEAPGYPPASTALPPLPMTAQTLGPKLPKSPWLAMVLSLFPGLGQVYNGQPSKAFIFFFGWVGSIYGAAEINPFPFAFLIPFVYFYNIVDAWRSANAINARFLGAGVLPEQDETFESPWWGGSLVALGLVILLHNLGWLNLSALSRYWPLLMIGAGGVFLWSSLRRGRR